MAHVQDRWEKIVAGRRVRTTRYGKGKRWQARYFDPDGHERAKDFARKQDAERFLATVTADVLRGAYVDLDALPPRYRAVGVVAAGCGLRQPETFGLRVQDIDFLRHRLRVEQQVKIVGGKLVLDRPKGGRTRVVPLPEFVAVELSEHIRRFPSNGLELVFTSREHKPLNRSYFNPAIWRPALRVAGVQPSRANGMHALRHFYASVLIDAGESVKAVAEYLGHADPGFTLRVYAHLFPSSEERARQAVDQAFGGDRPDGVTPPAYDG